MSSGDNQIYQWTVGDVRNLDSKLSDLHSDVREIRDSLKTHKIVVDNAPSADWNWRNLSLVIGSVAATILLVVQEVQR